MAGPRGLPAQEGIANFGRVNEDLCRGAQPDATAFQNLKRLGIKAIINLRISSDAWKAEAAEAQANGMVYTNAPMRGLGRPAEDRVRSILSLIESCPKPVFIHCEHGCDRTGTIVACYRIHHDGWTNQAALEEAVRYGLSKLERGMRRCIENFGKSPP